MNYPAWVSAPADQKGRRYNEMLFIIRRAALQHNREGSIPQLCQAIGISAPNLYHHMNLGRLMAEHALLIERLVGKEVAPKELLSPIFCE